MGTWAGGLGLTLKRLTVYEGDRYTHRNIRQIEESSMPEVKIVAKQRTEKDKHHLR